MFQDGANGTGSHRAAHAQLNSACSPILRWDARCLVLPSYSMLSLVYKARNTACVRLMANCYSSDADGKHTWLQQSHHVSLVPFTFLSAGSDTVTSLCRVLFHLSLMVLVCYWSRTCIQLLMKFTTPSCTNPKEHDSWKMHRVLGTTNVAQDFNLYQCSFPRACY